MHAICLLTVAFVIASADETTPPASQGPANRGAAPTISMERVDAAVAAEMKRQRVPGAAVAVVRRGEVALAKGYGEANVELHDPVTPDTVFQTGSVGKQFTAAAVMVLVDEGKLSLDDPVTKFWPDAGPWWRPVTVRHLLTHTSGMPNFEPGVTIDLRKDYTDEEFARMALALKPDFAPGSRWGYSNPGYVLLGCLVGEVTGRHYGELLRERLFCPLGMTTARVISEADVVPNRAAGYRLAGGLLKNQEWTSPSVNSTGDGALYVTLRDMIAWDAGVRRGAVLKPESWKATFTPARLNSGKDYPYGFGWFVDRERGQLRHHHGGAWQGFKTYISRYMDDDLTVILLTNQGQADPDVFADAIAGAIDPRLRRPTEPLADQDPALARRVRALLARARAGTLTAEDFAVLPGGYFPAVATHLHELLEPLGEPDGLELVERHQRGDDTWARWRAAFKGKTLEVTLTQAPDGRLAWFFVKPVDE